MLFSAPLDVPRSLDVDHSLTLGSDTHLDLDQLRIGTQADAHGFVTQLAGTVGANQLTIGDAGQGRYLLLGGQLSVNSIVLGAQAGALGEVNVAGGELLLRGGGGGIVVGGAGNGKLTLGTDTTPGEIHVAANARMPLVVAQSPGSHGVVQGWGTIDSGGGDLVNNGQVIGDGHGHKRALNLTSFDTVSGSRTPSNTTVATSAGTTSSLSNDPYAYNVETPASVADALLSGRFVPGTAAGLNTTSNDNANVTPSSPGWYVQGGGQVALPPIAIQPGSGTYTWGDSNDKSQIDLVNSVRLGVHDQPTATQLAISLRTVALQDPLDITLPGQTSVVGLWQFDHASTFDPSSVDVTVRYDDNATATLLPGAEALQMFAYEDGTWRAASDLSRDSWNDLISGKFGGSFDYLAVGVPWNADAALAPSASAAVNGVTPTPEPGLIAVGALASGLLMLRRHHRSKS
jgi:hypothetical protein